jgi:hypothetical protein
MRQAEVPSKFRTKTLAMVPAAQKKKKRVLTYALLTLDIETQGNREKQFFYR